MPFLIWEKEELLASPSVDPEHINMTITLLIFGGFIAFLLNLSELLVIEFSSALSLCVAGKTMLGMVGEMEMVMVMETGSHLCFDVQS